MGAPWPGLPQSRRHVSKCRRQFSPSLRRSSCIIHTYIHIGIHCVHALCASARENQAVRARRLSSLTRSVMSRRFIRGRVRFYSSRPGFVPPIAIPLCVQRICVYVRGLFARCTRDYVGRKEGFFFSASCELHTIAHCCLRWICSARSATWSRLAAFAARHLQCCAERYAFNEIHCASNDRECDFNINWTDIHNMFNLLMSVAALRGQVYRKKLINVHY